MVWHFYKHAVDIFYYRQINAAVVVKILRGFYIYKIIKVGNYL
jgi:hypothetical protein